MQAENVAPLRRLIHWGPIASLTITAVLTVATLSTGAKSLWILLFEASTCMSLYNMWCATLIGPGYVQGEKPGASKQQTGNEQPKTDKFRTRYCRRCEKIVLNKHHHCPWINNCVGENNDTYFRRFLVFAIAVSSQSATHIARDMYEGYVTVLSLLNFGLAIGVSVAVSALMYMH